MTIRLATAIRTMPALWLAVPVCLLAALYALFQPAFPLDPYSTAVTAAGTGTLPFLAPFSAAVAAWEGYRLRRSRVWAAANVRSTTEIAAWSILPAATVGTAAVLVAVVVEFARFAAGFPDLRLLAVSALVVLTHSTIGFALGVALPFVVAGPAALVTSFVWLAFVPALQPVWLRHVTGLFRDCCRLQGDLASQAVAASVIVNIGILVATLTLMSGTSSRKLAASISVLVVPMLLGLTMVAGMGFSPEVARDVSHLRCSSSPTVTVCVWPEHADRVGEVLRISDAVRTRWTDLGLEVPATFTEADPATIDGALTFAFNGVVATKDDLIEALADGMLPALPECPAGATGGIAFEYLRAWYAASGGLAESLLRAEYSYSTDPYPPVMTVVDELVDVSAEERREWIDRAEEVTQFCDDWPQEFLAVGP